MTAFLQQEGALTAVGIGEATAATPAAAVIDATNSSSACSGHWRQLGVKKDRKRKWQEENTDGTAVATCGGLRRASIFCSGWKSARQHMHECGVREWMAAPTVAAALMPALLSVIVSLLFVQNLQHV